MAISTTRLRQDIYRILDEVIETGVPVEIIRRGVRLVISIGDLPGRSKVDRLVQRPCIVGDPEDLIALDWSSGWHPDVDE